MGTPLVTGNRVLVVTTTTGTGTYQLGAAAAATYRTFADAGIPSGSRVMYVVQNSLDAPTVWEEGEGIYTDASPDTLTRAQVKGGSNGTSAVNWSAGTKYVLLTVHADRMPLLDTDGMVSADIVSSVTTSADGAVDITVPATGTVFELTANIVGLAGAAAGRGLFGYASLDGTNFVTTASYASQFLLSFNGTTASAQGVNANIEFASLYDVPISISRLEAKLFIGGGSNGIQFQFSHVRDGSTRAIRYGWVELNGVRIRKLRIVDSAGAGIRAGSFFSLRRVA
jgi:hypothetical protein